MRPLRLVSVALFASLACGCSPLLYALLSLRSGGGGSHELTVGRPVEGSTSGEVNAVTLSCGSPDGAGDESWTFVPPTSGSYRITVNGQYDCAVGLYGPDDAQRSIACNDDSGSNNLSRVDASLEAGRRYVVVVDGYRGNEGSYRLTVEPGGPPTVGPAVGPGGPTGPGPTVGGPALPTVVPEDAVAMQPRCVAAPLLGVGTLSGNLDPTVATARTSCGSGPGGDVIYRLVVQTPGQVTIKLEAAFDGILELRSSCSGGGVIACNDDTGDALHSQVSAPLGVGTYYLVVDSYDPRSSGPFTLQVIPQ